MNAPSRILSVIDRSRLFDVGDSHLLSAGHSIAQIRGLNRLLNRSQFVEANQFPPDVVTMNSRVRVTMTGEDSARELTIVFPEEASHAEGRISILTPMAQAILGARVGEVVAWHAPAGELSARVDELLFQPESNMNRS